MLAKIFALGCRRYGSRVNGVCSFDRGGAGGGATASAQLSSLWGQLGWWERRDSFAISATVYMAVHNKEGDSFQPIGNVRGMSTIGSSSALLGKIRPSLGASSGRIPIQ